MTEHKHTNRLNNETSPSAGVYQILCLPTGKIYIGSAVDLWERWGKHRLSLRHGNHRNAHLQNAWNKYGEANFVCSVLEFVKKADLLRAEQAWINKTGCTNRDMGFNIYDVAGSPGDMFAQVWQGFIDPDGNEVTITNLYEFCRQHKLDFPSMHRLAKGKSKLKSYKGWSHRNSVRQRDYVKTYSGFITPDARPAGLITNLAAFCRKHGLDNTHMVAVARGRIYSHRGWTYDNDRQNRQKLGLPKTYTSFINPNGHQIVITNLKAFCREYGLEPVHMYQLISGKRKSHKGWTWRKENE
jgi:group I intron endonuclease